MRELKVKELRPRTELELAREARRSGVSSSFVMLLNTLEQ